MYTKEAYNSLLKSTAQNIDISDEMFEAAEKTYKDLGKWIDQETPDYEISIYPQGSFALGTVVRPITNADDYDLDIVCQFKSQYGLTAKELKVDVVKPLLVRYKKTSREIEEKKRCWHVEYDDVPNFHMDVIPAHTYGSVIRITDHNEDDDTYDYLGSNPAGYVKWFFDACAKQRNRLYEQYIKDHRTVVAQAEVEDVKRRKVKTPLQRVVQILKRHRDIKFADDNSGNKPISIIITTIAGRLYEEEGFRYFLLTKECKKENRGKVKVKKWLGITNLKAYEQYISDWHQFLLTCEESIGELEKENIQILTTYILRLFYQTPYEAEDDGSFYQEFYQRREQVRKTLGI